MVSETIQSVIIANKAIKQVEVLFTRLDAIRIFFVVDQLAYKLSGASKTLEVSFKDRIVEWFYDFELNPKLEDVESGIDLFRKSAADVVLALGGGSALDIAKLIAGCGTQEGKALDYIKGDRTLNRPHPPLIAIPTTAGTGSEATHFAVVYIGEQKYSLAHPLLLPEYVLIDPQLTYALPPRITAASGLDALAQSIESIWSVGATDESIGYASEALSFVLNNLEAAVNKPTPESRIAMAKAAHLAGKAINISKTTAPHALSYAITTHYKVPHGIAVALTLDVFLGYNYRVDEFSCTDPRGVDRVRQRMDLILELLGDGSIEKAQSRLRLIKENIGCPLNLSEVGIKKNGLLTLVSQVNVERLSNNPRKINATGLNDLLNSIL